MKWLNLAIAFIRLFGANVAEVNTFNSAGFIDAASDAANPDAWRVVS